MNSVETCTTESAGRRVVLVGLNYSPRRGTGDKNFWASLIPIIAESADRITVLSVRDETMGSETESVGDCQITTRYIPPMLVRPPAPDSGSRSLAWRKGSYPRVFGFVDKQILLRRVGAALADTLRREGSGRVHLMDNFGPGNRYLARVARKHESQLSVTAIAYERRGRAFYDQFLRLSYATESLDTVALSRALERRLRAMGVPKHRLRRIPWGVRSDPDDNSMDRSVARAALGLPSERPLVVWAGFIQQVREPDFRLALSIAKTALEGGLPGTVAFAFKPETFRREYAELHDPGRGLHILETPRDTFTLVRQAADVMMSPLESRDCIVAPPLTWIELMARGCPVLTTDVPGANELVEHGSTGLLARSTDDLVKGLFKLVEESGSMRDACRDKVLNDYNLSSIARSYCRLWFDGAET